MSLKVRRALISVSDKAGVIELGKALANAGVEILSTGTFRFKTLVLRWLRCLRAGDDGWSCKDAASENSRRNFSAARYGRGCDAG